MSDFQQAVQWMKEGKIVIRTTHNRRMASVICEVVCLDDRDVVLGLDDYEATDWEIYDENEWKEWQCWYGPGNEWISNKACFDNERTNLQELTYNFFDVYAYYLGKTPGGYDALWRKKK